MPENRTLVYAGAHHGNTLADLIWKFDRVIAIEPHHDCIAVLRSRFGKRIELIEAAVGAEDGIALFHPYSPDDGSGSLGQINVLAKSLLLSHRENKTDFDERSAFQVNVIHLGDRLDMMHVGFIELLVSDVQGMDLTLLKSVERRIAAGTIGRIQCEVDHDDVPHYDGLPSNSRRDVVEWFARYPHYKCISKDVDGWDLRNDLQRDFVWELA